MNNFYCVYPNGVRLTKQQKFSIVETLKAIVSRVMEAVKAMFDAITDIMKVVREKQSPPPDLCRATRVKLPYLENRGKLPNVKMPQVLNNKPMFAPIRNNC